MNTATVTLSPGFVSFAWPSVPLATQYRIITTLTTGWAQTSVSPAGSTSAKIPNPSGKFTVRVYADTPKGPIVVPAPTSVSTPIPAAPLPPAGPLPFPSLYAGANQLAAGGRYIASQPVNIPPGSTLDMNQSTVTYTGPASLAVFTLNRGSTISNGTICTTWPNNSAAAAASAPLAISVVGTGNKVSGISCKAMGSGIATQIGSKQTTIENFTCDTVGSYAAFLQGDEISIDGFTSGGSYTQDIVRQGSTQTNGLTINNMTLTAFATGGRATLALQKVTNATITNSTFNGGVAGVGPQSGNELNATQHQQNIAAYSQNVTFSGCTFNTSLLLQPGCGDVTISGNTFNNPGNPAIVINAQLPASGPVLAGEAIGDYKDYAVTVGSNINRTLAQRIIIEGNSGVSDSTTGTFLTLAGVASGIQLLSNDLNFPNLIPGENGSAYVYCRTADLESFAKISGNKYGATAKANYHVPLGSVNYVLVGANDLPAGYKPLAAWNAMGATDVAG